MGVVTDHHVAGTGSWETLSRHQFHLSPGPERSRDNGTSNAVGAIPTLGSRISACWVCSFWHMPLDPRLPDGEISGSGTVSGRGSGWAGKAGPERAFDSRGLAARL